MLRANRPAATTLAVLITMSLGAAPTATADDHEVPSTKVKIGGKKRPGHIQGAVMSQPAEVDGIPTCRPNDTVFGGQWPRPLKLRSKRYRAKIVLSTSRVPETVAVERRVYEYPPPPGSAIEGKAVRHKLVPIRANGVTVRFLVKFRLRVPRKTLYVQLAVRWPDEGDCEGDWARYAWVLKGKAA